MKRERDKKNGTDWVECACHDTLTHHIMDVWPRVAYRAHHQAQAAVAHTHNNFFSIPPLICLADLIVNNVLLIHVCPVDVNCRGIAAAAAVPWKLNDPTKSARQPNRSAAVSLLLICLHTENPAKLLSSFFHLRCVAQVIG